MPYTPPVTRLKNDVGAQAKHYADRARVLIAEAKSRGEKLGAVEAVKKASRGE